MPNMDKNSQDNTDHVGTGRPWTSPLKNPWTFSVPSPDVHTINPRPAATYRKAISCGLVTMQPHGGGRGVIINPKGVITCASLKEYSKEQIVEGLPVIPWCHQGIQDKEI